MNENQKWNIKNEGRKWSKKEVEEKYFKLCPEKIELIEGKLFWSDEERLAMLAMLLENLGADKAVRLGDKEVARPLDLKSRGFRHCLPQCGKLL